MSVSMKGPGQGKPSDQYTQGWDPLRGEGPSSAEVWPGLAYARHFVSLCLALAQHVCCIAVQHYHEPLEKTAFKPGWQSKR